jgi:hypothetical protein
MSKKQKYSIPYCESCWERGFVSVARVVVGEGERRRALCIGCHGDYERDKEGSGSAS